MNKRNIQIVIAFSFLALLGTVGIQYYWVQKIYEQNQLLFDQNTQRALKFAVSNLQQEEHLVHMNEFYFDHNESAKDEIENRLYETHDKVKNSLIVNRQKQESIEQTLFLKEHDFDTLLENIIIINQNKTPNTNIQIFHHNYAVDFSGNDTNIDTQIRIKVNWDSVYSDFENKADSLINVLEFRTIDLKNEQLEIEATVDQLVWEMNEWTRPFTENIPPELIQSILDKTIDEFHLPTDFDFALFDYQSADSAVFSTENYKTKKASYTYFTNLYPNELISRQQSLSLQFNNNPLFNSMLTPILLSLSFTLILLLGFILIIRNLLHHRNVSEMQSDFINNMTHEFKTPIATISLASDSILTPSVLKDTEQVGYFTGMIKKENRRMNRLVEKILQMARLENKELELTTNKINVHELLEIILENTQVKLNGNGTISSSLLARDYHIMADQDHFTNVIYNLLDNAIKYSSDKINIKLETRNTKTMFCLLVSDEGKGMNKKEIQHIFDRFYRIESGNVHNVKGYGLGLTYVKAIIEKHKGQVIVKSEEGVGSTFEIRLPFVD